MRLFKFKYSIVGGIWVSILLSLCLTVSVGATPRQPLKSSPGLFCVKTESGKGQIVNKKGKKARIGKLSKKLRKKARKLTKKLAKLSSQSKSRSSRGNKLAKIEALLEAVEQKRQEISICQKNGEGSGSEPGPTPTATPEPTPEGSATPTPEPTPEGSATPTPEPTAVPTSTPETTPTPTIQGSNQAPQAQSFTIMDFEDSVLHDTNWLLTQPENTVALVVEAKSDSGASQLSLAPGAGIGGSNALLVESLNGTMGLPGFWGIKYRNRGSYLDLPQDKDGYLLPEGKRANRLEFWIRFEDGFRANAAAQQPPSYPNHQNLHFGTYHFDPAKIGLLNGVVESDNWHFYHQLFLRHDQAGSNWIHVVLNEMPQHERSLSSAPPVNPTRWAGNYWELLTRFYIDPVAYFADPEKAYPVKMWVDDIKLSYVPEPTDIQVQIESFSSGEIVGAQRDVQRDFTVTIENTSSSAITGTLFTDPGAWMRAELLDPQSFVSVAGSYTIQPGAKRSFLLRINPYASLSEGRIDDVGFTFVPDDQVRSDATSSNRSASDPNIEKRWYLDTGSHDGVVYGDFIQVKIVP